MNKYYYVPVTCRLVKCQGDSLFEILGMVDEELYNRELSRVDLLYGGDTPEYGSNPEIQNLVESFNKETSLKFAEKRFPERIVLVDDGNELKELATGINFACNISSFLEVFSISGEQVVDVFYENTNYSEYAENFITQYLKEKGKGKGKKVKIK